MLTMNSSWPSACAMRAPLGADSTGLLATDDQRPDAAGPVGLDLLGQAAGGVFAQHLGRARDAAARAPGDHAAADARPALRVGRERRGLREHRAAFAVEMAGEDVERVDQHRVQRAEALRARADARVDRRARRARRAGAPARAASSAGTPQRAAMRSGVYGATAACSASTPVSPVGEELAEPARLHQAFVEQRVAAAPAAGTRRCRGG